MQFEGGLFWAALAIMITEGVGGTGLSLFMIVAVLVAYTCRRIMTSRKAAHG